MYTDECVLVSSELSRRPSQAHLTNLCQQQKPIEEIIMEANDPMSKNNYTRLVIKRRANNGVYYCQLCLQPNQTSEVVFRLGTACEAEK